MSLTRAERQAVEAVATFGTVKQAAAALGKSAHTVKQQVESARARLGVSTTIAAYRKMRDSA